jgi:hypothetical protein
MFKSLFNLSFVASKDMNQCHYHNLPLQYYLETMLMYNR